MNYNQLVGNKATEGSIKRDVNYEDIDPAVIVEEAETLIYDTLRVREMRQRWAVAVAVGDYTVALPARYLDPVGDLRDSKFNRYIQRSEERVLAARTWTESVGSLGTDPFAVTSGSATITVTHTSHGLYAGDVVTLSGATAGGGITIDGAYEVVERVDADSYTITHSDAATSTDATTGGSAVTYVYDKMDVSQPRFWTVLGEYVQFEMRFEEARMLYLPYYRQPAPLSTTNTNFLTDRYPHILRTATRIRAHTWMKNWTGVGAESGFLTGFIASANMRADMSYRGGDYDQELA